MSVSPSHSILLGVNWEEDAHALLKLWEPTALSLRYEKDVSTYCSQTCLLDESEACALLQWWQLSILPVTRVGSQSEC